MFFYIECYRESAVNDQRIELVKLLKRFQAYTPEQKKEILKTITTKLPVKPEITDNKITKP